MKRGRRKMNNGVTTIPEYPTDGLEIRTLNKRNTIHSFLQQAVTCKPYLTTKNPEHYIQ